MRKMKYLFLSVVLVVGLIACNTESGDESGISHKKNKEKVNTEEVGSITDSEEEGDTKDKEDTEESKVPVPSEKYVLFKEVHDNGYSKTYEYNEKGHPVKSTSVNKANETVVIIYTYTYNADGSYCVQEDGGSIVYKRYKEYDSKDRMVLYDYGDQVTTYVYDEKDRVIESKATSDKGRVRSWIKTEYNDAGEVAKESYFYGDGSSAGRYEYEYTETDTIRHAYDPEGEFLETDHLVRTAWEYDYDEFGRVIYEARKDVERGGAYEKYFYEYDEAGGMCKKTDGVQEIEYEYKPLSQCLFKQ